MTPTPKVAAAAAAGALLTLATFVAALFGLELNLPDFTVTLLTTAITFAVGYIKHDEPGQHAAE